MAEFEGNMWSKVRTEIDAWYEGQFVAPPNDPNSMIIFTSGSYRRHWTARIARMLVAFWLEHWKWIITMGLTVAGLVANALRTAGH